MKISEELYLKSTILQINEYSKENNNVESFYENLDALSIKSLQDLSFNNDLKFFDEVNFILSVIISIVIHPHISNTREKIILRSDQVGSLQNDMFLETMRDASLWKHNKQKEMIPEYVHYYQNIDELRIYENLFIVMLIDILASELNKYNEFYSKMILTYDGIDTLSLSNDKVQVAFENIEKLLKRIRKIKNTYFYKAISQGGKVKLNHITPTNILLKDRLYNYCFKFYRKIISYEDENVLVNDFTSYYYVLLLKYFKENNYELVEGNLNSFSYDNNLSFKNEEFIVSLSYDNLNKAIKVSIKHEAIEKTFNHLLIIDAKSINNEDELPEYSMLNTYQSVDLISLWDRKYLENNHLIYIKQNILSEQQLINQYLNDHLMIVKGSKKIYSQFCPICKSKSISGEDELFLSCTHCHSSFAFIGNNNNDEKIWFLKLKR